MQVRRRDYGSVEMQMGPMIDMTFLLLVFFMVTAKPIKQESDMSFSLPGTVEQSEPVELPDEARIIIDDKGQAMLNEMPMDTPASTEMPTLVQTLKRFREASEANRTDALVTIVPSNECKHQRIVDVLNACAKAKVTGVTFGQPEEAAADEF